MMSESDQLLRAILETAVEGIITIDERGTVRSMNPAAETIFGFRAEEVVGRNVSLLMPSPFREGHDASISNYLRTGTAKVIGIGREAVGQRKDGVVFPIDLAVSEVQVGGRRLFTGFIRDITERKRAEMRQHILYATTRALAVATSLQEAAPALLQAVCEKTSWSIGELWIVDPEAQVLRYMGSGRLPGIRAPEFTSEAPRVCFSKGEGIPGRVWATAQPLWIDTPAQDRYCVRADAAGREGLMAAFAAPILLGAEVEGVMLFFTRALLQPDAELLSLFHEMGSQVAQFVERTRAEEKLAAAVRTLADKNKELETIVYVASHDLRSPLVNIQGFSKELAHACRRLSAAFANDAIGIPPELRALVPDDIPESLQYIEASVSKMDTLLSGFLRYSRLGRASLKIERLNMKALVERVLQAMEFQFKNSGASLTVSALPDCMGDAVQVGQVFSNLLDNALKYLDSERRGKIEVSGIVEGERSVYTVRDNGVGIAPEHQDKIFEVFHRLNPSAGEGEGLGLSIAQRILQRQDGRIWVESAPGQGSTFFVALPAAR